MENNCVLCPGTNFKSNSSDCPVKTQSPYLELKELLNKHGISSCTFAFIGGGKITNCLVEAFLSTGIIHKNSIAISVKSEKTKIFWEQRGYVNVFTVNDDLLSKFGYGVVILAVHPEAWKPLASKLSVTAFSETKLIISLMAGITISDLQNSIFGYKKGFIRMMPNIPVFCGAGTFILCSDAGEKIEIAKFLAAKIGVYKEVDESKFNVATALAGCGPAFVYTIIDALADGGVINGLSRSEAIELAAQTISGAAKMVLATGEHPGKLKDDVCTPSGATIAGIRALERLGLRHSLIEAICESTKRLNEM